MFIEPPKLEGLKFQAVSSQPQTVVNICQALGPPAVIAFCWLPGVSSPADIIQGFEGNFCTGFGLLSLWLPLFQDFSHNI